MGLKKILSDSLLLVSRNATYFCILIYFIFWLHHTVRDLSSLIRD